MVAGVVVTSGFLVCTGLEDNGTTDEEEQKKETTTDDVDETKVTDGAARG